MTHFKKIIAVVLLIPALALLCMGPSMGVSRFENVVAMSALLAEVDSGTVLFEFNMRRRHPADELTKIMTLLLAVTAIENGEANSTDTVVMTESAWLDLNSSSAAGSNPINPGEEMTLIDLMYSAYVGNISEACNMIAEYLSGSVDAFVERMNIRARDMGCDDTHFVNTHGQHNENQYTTARDLFIIFREAMSSPLFVEISSTYRYTTGETRSSEPRRLTSANSLLNQNGKYYYRHCIAGIPSNTYEGRLSFVGMAESDGLSLISVILGSDEIMNEDESYDLRNLTETRRLFEWGYANFGIRSIISSTELVARVPVAHGAGADFVNLRPESSIELLLDNEIPIEEFVRTIRIYSDENDEPLVAPIEAGDVLGEVTISRNGFEYDTILLVANTSIELHRFEYIRMQVAEALSTPMARNVIIALVILVAAYIALVIRYNVIRSKRLSAIKKAKDKLIEERQTQTSKDEFD